MKSRCSAVLQHLQTCAKTPCQGEGREFESRLVLNMKKDSSLEGSFFIFKYQTRVVLSQTETRKNENGGPHADILILPVASCEAGCHREEARLT